LLLTVGVNHQFGLHLVYPNYSFGKTLEILDALKEPLTEAKVEKLIKKNFSEEASFNLIKLLPKLSPVLNTDGELASLDKANKFKGTKMTDVIGLCFNNHIYS